MRARSCLSREVADPVRFPGLAAVRGARLLPPCRARRDMRPDDARQNLATVDRILAEERADTVRERAARRRADDVRIATVEPPAEPFLFRRIECTQPDAAHDAARKVHDVVADVAVAAEHRPIHERAVRGFPVLTADET